MTPDGIVLFCFLLQMTGMNDSCCRASINVVHSLCNPASPLQMQPRRLCSMSCRHAPAQAQGELLCHLTFQQAFLMVQGKYLLQDVITHFDGAGKAVLQRNISSCIFDGAGKAAACHHTLLLAQEKLFCSATSHHASLLVQEKLFCSFCSLAAHQSLEPDMPARCKPSVQAVKGDADRGQNS